MKTILHQADTRGHTNFGWLDSWHTFSFGAYYQANRKQFGALRVLNDDRVEPGMGFGTHPHENMEIISIPLEGELMHRDDMGHVSVIKAGDVQVMSAGSGILHSEFNHSKDHPVSFLQIWVYPNQKNVPPRYDQMSVEYIKQPNQWHQIVSPNKEDQGLWIHQEAWFYLGRFDAASENSYLLKKETNGLYVFVIEGDVQVADGLLRRRDGMGIWNTPKVDFQMIQSSTMLLMEIPM
jgi:redox-sensitive bicupin YhaK (pirin superfamily)